MPVKQASVVPWYLFRAPYLQARRGQQNSCGHSWSQQVVQLHVAASRTQRPGAPPPLPPNPPHPARFSIGRQHAQTGVLSAPVADSDRAILTARKLLTRPDGFSGEGRLIMGSAAASSTRWHFYQQPPIAVTLHRGTASSSLRALCSPA